MTSSLTLHPPARATAPRPGSIAAAGHESAVTLSVIVVSYNSRHHLGPCLQSVLAAAGPQVEVILVDNASTDGSAEYVERCFPEVWVVRNADNFGFGHANNVGVGYAQGEYLAFLNPDTVVEPGWWEALIRALEHDPGAGLVTARILLSDLERINTCGNAVHLTGLTLCRGMGESRAAFDQPAQVAAVSGAAFAVRKELFQALGGFDDDFFLYVEDTDLSCRARLAGRRILYVPEAVVYHDYVLQFGPRKTFYQERNRYLLLLKNLRWRTLLVLLPALVLGEIVTWGFVLLREPRRLTNKLQAYAWIMTHWERVLRSRRRTQALREVRDRDLLADCTGRLSFEQTGEGLAARLAGVMFDPLFRFWRWAALALIHW